MELYSKYHGVKFRQIKSAKVSNLVNSFPSGISYDFMHSKSFTSDDLTAASEFISTSNKSKVKYEGSIQLSKAPTIFSTYRNAIFRFPRAFLSYCKSQLINNLKDHHYISPLSYWYFSYLVQPMRWNRANNIYNFRTIEQLTASKNNSYYLFFPLHHEPEVSIQVYGCDSLNQIEVIRKLSLATPHDVVILVKEHPRSIGFRSSSFYSKLLQIPKVCLVNPYTTSTEILSITDMTAVISSSISIESACKKIPVLHFGDIFIQGISKDMVLNVSSISSIRSAFFICVIIIFITIVASKNV